MSSELGFYLIGSIVQRAIQFVSLSAKTSTMITNTKINTCTNASMPPDGSLIRLEGRDAALRRLNEMHINKVGSIFWYSSHFLIHPKTETKCVASNEHTLCKSSLYPAKILFLNADFKLRQPLLVMH